MPLAAASGSNLGSRAALLTRMSRRPNLAYGNGSKLTGRLDAGHIQAEACCRVPGIRQISGDFVGGGLIQVCHHDGCARFGERLAELGAKQPRSPGNNSHLSFEIEFILDHETLLFRKCAKYPGVAEIGLVKTFDPIDDNNPSFRHLPY